MSNFIKKIGFIIFYISSFSLSSNEYWQQFVDYEIDVVLVDSVRQLACKSKIYYKNNSPYELNEIFFHLYPNAFQTESLKSKEYLSGYGRESRGKYFKEGLEGYESKIHIRNFTIAKNKNIILDDYKIDDTILHAKLKNNILPGEEVRIDIDWNHHIGGMVERAGYYNGQYNMAQWYPKLAVFDELGWHAEPFHAEGEFYGEFGNFLVNFELPKRFIIGSTGVVSEGDPGWEMVKVDTNKNFYDWFETFNNDYKEPGKDQKRFVQFTAKNVHDFAWVASPNFLYEHDKFEQVDVHILYNKINAFDWNRVVRQRTVRAMHWMSGKFGNYIYPQVTNVDRLKPGGMEYPMLIMDGSDSESLILHEVGHIWFYGILGNNELNEAWLDEGLTTSQTRDYMVNRYGPIGFDWQSDDWTHMYQRKFWSFNKKLDNDQWGSIKYILSGFDEPISRKSYLFKNSFSYRQNAYSKPSLMLNELKHLMGDSLYYLSIQNFFLEWKLKHVNEQRFKDSIEKITGKNWNWFFDQWLHDTRVLDYSIEKWSKKRKSDGSYNVKIEIKNLGNRYIPVFIQTKLIDGSIDQRWFNNPKLKKEYTFNVATKPKTILLDPFVQTLDVDYRNNSTSMDYKIVFDWPGMNYNPRDKIVYAWLPSMHYNNIDKYMPGIQVRRYYSNYENQIFRLNFVNSKNLFKDVKFYWYYSGSFKPVHFYSDIKLNIDVYNQPGIECLNFEIKRINHNKAYNNRPTFSSQIGVNYISKVDTNRTKLYSKGNFASLYVNYGVINNFFKHSLTLSSSLPISTSWNFIKIKYSVSGKSVKILSSENILRSTLGITHAGLRSRMFLGKFLTSNSRVPLQEYFRISGNNSKDMYQKSYLRSEYSFFGNKDFHSSYHLPGDGNIRSFGNLNYLKLNQMISFSNEFYFLNKHVNENGFLEDRFLNFEFAFFSDIGYLNQENKFYLLSNSGLGLRLKTNIFNKTFYFRVDFPIHSYNNLNFAKGSKYVISFSSILDIY